MIAAKRLGRKFIGIDIDEKYVNITKNKLSKELSDSKIGDIWVSFYLNKIVTIRNMDWEKLASYFLIPENIKDIDFKKIKLDESQGKYHRKKEKLLSIHERKSKDN